MAVPVRAPLAQPGETRTIIAWTKEIGDPVSAGEPICEVETDKATVEIESQADGVLVAKLFEVGAEIPEDGPIAMVGDPDEIGAAEIGTADAAAEPGDAAPPEPAVPPEPAAPPAPQPAAPRRLAVSPRARKRAAELSVTLAGLTGTGTGPGGRIIEREACWQQARWLPALRPSPPLRRPPSLPLPTLPLPNLPRRIRSSRCAAPAVWSPSGCTHRCATRRSSP